LSKKNFIFPLGDSWSPSKIKPGTETSRMAVTWNVWEVKRGVTRGRKKLLPSEAYCDGKKVRGTRSRGLVQKKKRHERRREGKFPITKRSIKRRGRSM